MHELRKHLAGTILCGLVLIFSSCTTLVGWGAQIFGVDHGSGRTHDFYKLHPTAVQQACIEAADAAGYSVDLRPEAEDLFTDRSSGYLLRSQPEGYQDQVGSSEYPRLYIYIKAINLANDEKRRVHVKVMGGPDDQRAVLDHIRRLLHDPRPGDPLARPATPGG